LTADHRAQCSLRTRRENARGRRSLERVVDQSGFKVDEL